MIGRRGLVALAVGWVLASPANAGAATEWTIRPGDAAGPVGRATSERDLIDRYGPDRVRRIAVDIGEGQTQPGTILFPDDPTRRARILWRDAQSRLAPSAVIVRDQGTRWQTDTGITIGTPLTTLERINGRPLLLVGFGWDRGGTLVSAHGGRLRSIDSDAPRTLLVSVEPPPDMQRSPSYRAVVGDHVFSSGHPAMRALRPRVAELIAEFPAR